MIKPLHSKLELGLILCVSAVPSSFVLSHLVLHNYKTICDGKDKRLPWPKRKKKQAVTVKAYTSVTKRAYISWAKRPQCGHLPCLGFYHFNICSMYCSKCRLKWAWTLILLLWTAFRKSPNPPSITTSKGVKMFTSSPRVTMDSQIKLQQ